jgi:RNA polymerase sigma-70 factor (ECF subfamily)
LGIFFAEFRLKRSLKEAAMATAQTSEIDVLELARAGDEEAFAQLVGPLRDRIYWRAVKAVGDLDEADDVTQETLMRAFTRLDTFRGDARFSSWLYMVGSNCIRMHLRTRRRKGALRYDDHLNEVEAGVAQGRDAEREHPDIYAMNKEFFTALEEAMSQLPPQYGSILRLWVEDGLDLKQIQERSGLSIPAIKSRLHRARQRLRDRLEGRFGVGVVLAA